MEKASRGGKIMQCPICKSELEEESYTEEKELTNQFFLLNY